MPLTIAKVIPDSQSDQMLELRLAQNFQIVAQM